MEESNSSQPPRCPCGFWGSPKTLGLCSKCYQEQMESSKEALESAEVSQPSVAPASTSKAKNGAKSSPKPSLAHTGHATTVAPDDLAPAPCRSSSSSSLLPPESGELVLAPAPPKPPSSAATETFQYPHVDVSRFTDTTIAPSGLTFEKVSSTSCSSVSLGKFTESLSQNELRSSKSQKLVAEPSPPASRVQESPEEEEEEERKGTKRKAEDDVDDEEESRPVQKNKRRCFQCSCKLELAQRQIGTCRCGYVFCPLHRLPELHNCEFDHKEDGRREARQKMVKPTRHLGTSFKRMDSDS